MYPRPRWKVRCPGEQSVGTHIIYDGTARAGSRDYGSRTKFIAHFNSYSQPSTELLVLFAQTLHSFNAAFVKDNMLLWHVCRPRYVSGELRCSFVSGNSRKSARFVILRVEAPPSNHEPTKKCRLFRGSLTAFMHDASPRSALPQYLKVDPHSRKSNNNAALHPNF
jgi:hypothetical protein